jgi:hypothetical protein
MMFVAVFLTARVLIGPPPLILAKLRGETLFIHEKTIDLGKLKADDKRNVSFTVANLSRNALKIVSTKTSCSCTSAVPSFPITIEPSAKIPLDFAFKAPDSAGTFTEFIEIKSDGSPNVVVCRIIGSIEASSPSTQSSR